MPATLSTVTSTVRADPAAPKPAAPAPAAAVVPSGRPETPPAAPAAPAELDPVAKLQAEIKAKEDALTQRERKFRNELKKNAEEKEGLGSKLKRGEEAEKRAAELEAKLAAREKEDRLAGLNPIASLEKQFGKDWVKRANELAATGVPPADLIAAEMQRMRDEFQKMLDERDAKAKSAADEREQSTRAQQERDYQQLKESAVAEGAEFYQQSADAYPIFGYRKFSPEQVGRMLADRIEHVARTTGQELTYRQAADAIEAEALELTEFAASSPKYGPRLQEKFKPAVVEPSSGVQGVPGAASTTRRTLGNHLTASTSDRPPAKTPAEKLQRAREVYESTAAANLAKRSGS